MTMEYDRISQSQNGPISLSMNDLKKMPLTTENHGSLSPKKNKTKKTVGWLKGFFEIEKLTLVSVEK